MGNRERNVERRRCQSESGFNQAPRVQSESPGGGGVGVFLMSLCERHMHTEEQLEGILPPFLRQLYANFSVRTTPLSPTSPL